MINDKRTTCQYDTTEGMRRREEGGGRREGEVYSAVNLTASSFFIVHR